MQLQSQAERTAAPCLCCTIKGLFRDQKNEGSIVLSCLYSPLPPLLLQGYVPLTKPCRKCLQAGNTWTAALFSSLIYLSTMPHLPATQHKHVKESLCL